MRFLGEWLILSIQDSEYWELLTSMAHLQNWPLQIAYKRVI